MALQLQLPIITVAIPGAYDFGSAAAAFADLPVALEREDQRRAQLPHPHRKQSNNSWLSSLAPRMASTLSLTRSDSDGKMPSRAGSGQSKLKSSAGSKSASQSRLNSSVGSGQETKSPGRLKSVNGAVGSGHQPLPFKGLQDSIRSPEDMSPLSRVHSQGSLLSGITLQDASTRTSEGQLPTSVELLKARLPADADVAAIGKGIHETCGAETTNSVSDAS